MEGDRKSVAFDGIQDLLASKTWKPAYDDLNFAVGYVSSYVRQVTGIATTKSERDSILEALLVVVRHAR